MMYVASWRLSFIKYDFVWQFIRYYPKKDIREFSRYFLITKCFHFKFMFCFKKTHYIFISVCVPPYALSQLALLIPFIRFPIARSHVKSLQFSITKLTPCQAALQSMQRTFLRRTNKNNWGKSATCEGWRGGERVRGGCGNAGVLARMAILLLLPDCLMTGTPQCPATFNPSQWHCMEKRLNLFVDKNYSLN